MLSLFDLPDWELKLHDVVAGRSADEEDFPLGRIRYRLLDAPKSPRDVLPIERELRVKTEWDAFVKKPHMSAVQFEAEWERHMAELREVGLPQDSKQLFIDYIRKVGGTIAESIRIDRRKRPNLAPDAKEGDMVMFPSWMVHQVVNDWGTTTGKVPYRIVYAFNLCSNSIEDNPYYPGY